MKRIVELGHFGDLAEKIWNEATEPGISTRSSIPYHDVGLHLADKIYTMDKYCDGTDFNQLHRNDLAMTLLMVGIVLNWLIHTPLRYYNISISYMREHPYNLNIDKVDRI